MLFFIRLVLRDQPQEKREQNSFINLLSRIILNFHFDKISSAVNIKTYQRNTAHQVNGGDSWRRPLVRRPWLRRPPSGQRWVKPLKRTQVGSAINERAENPMIKLPVGNEAHRADAVELPRLPFSVFYSCNPLIHLKPRLIHPCL